MADAWQESFQKLEAWHGAHGSNVCEGHSGQPNVSFQKYTMRDQAQLLEEELGRPLVMVEIGFNAGHSANNLLAATSAGSTLVSFDIGEHQYVAPGKTFVDKMYPGRHRLIKGNSLETVPKFFRETPEFRADLIFIDGGHTYACASGDLRNCLELANETRNVVIMDDVVRNPQMKMYWTEGPTRAWAELIAEGLLVEDQFHEIESGRGFVIGEYQKKK